MRSFASLPRARLRVIGDIATRVPNCIAPTATGLNSDDMGGNAARKKVTANMANRMLPEFHRAKREIKLNFYYERES